MPILEGKNWHLQVESKVLKLTQMGALANYCKLPFQLFPSIVSSDLKACSLGFHN